MPFDDLIKEYVPANLRLLAGTALGDRSPINESYFKEEDLQAMRRAAIAAQLAHRARVEYYAAARDSYSKLRPNEPAIYTVVPDHTSDGKLIFRKENVQTAAQVAADYEQQRQAAATAAAPIRYEHYGPVSNVLDETGWIDSAKRSLSDPNFRMMTSIGRANVKPDAQGNSILRDEYSFHGESPDISKPTQILDAVMAYIAGKGKGRDVTLNLGQLPEQQ